MSEETDFPRFATEWEERRRQTKRDRDIEIEAAQSNFNHEVESLDQALRNEFQEECRKLTAERDAIMAQLSSLIDRRTAEKEKYLAWERSVKLEKLSKILNTKCKEAEDRLSMKLQEQEANFLATVGHRRHSQPPAPQSVATHPSQESQAQVQPKPHSHSHSHSHSSTPTPPVLQSTPAPSVLAQPRQPPTHLQQHVSANPPPFSSPPGKSISTQLQAPQPFQPQAPKPLQPHPPQAYRPQVPQSLAPAPPPNHSKFTARHSNIPPQERRTLERVPTLASQLPVNRPTAAYDQAPNQNGARQSQQQHENTQGVQIPQHPRYYEQSQHRHHNRRHQLQQQQHNPQDQQHHDSSRPHTPIKSPRPPYPSLQPQPSRTRPAQPPKTKLQPASSEIAAEKPAPGEKKRPVEQKSPAEQPMHMAEPATMSRSLSSTQDAPVEPCAGSARSTLSEKTVVPVDELASGMKGPRHHEKLLKDDMKQVEEPEAIDLTMEVDQATEADEPVEADAPVQAEPHLVGKLLKIEPQSGEPSSPAPDSMAVSPHTAVTQSERPAEAQSGSLVPAPESQGATPAKKCAPLDAFPESVGHKRTAAAANSHERDRKRARHSAPEPSATSPPVSTHPRTISFDEVYQNGNAKWKHTIFDYPPGSEKYFIVKCDEHGVHFKITSPVTGAAKHLNGRDHGHLSKNRQQAVDILGYHVYDCTPELAEKNNEVFRNAYANGYLIFTHKNRFFRETYFPDGTPREGENNLLEGGEGASESPREPSKSPVPEVPMVEPRQTPKAAQKPIPKSSKPGPKPGPKSNTKPTKMQGVPNAVAGEIYYGWWAKNKSTYAVVVCGRHEQSCIGLPDKTLPELWPTLLKGAPQCYEVDKEKQAIVGWAPGYEDGGPRVNQRSYPVQFFDKSRGVSWLQSRYLSPFLMVDPNRPVDKWNPFNQARLFYAKLRGFDSFAEWEAAGAKHCPVSPEAVRRLAAEGPKHGPVQSERVHDLTSEELDPKENPGHAADPEMSDEELNYALGVGLEVEVRESQDDGNYKGTPPVRLPRRGRESHTRGSSTLITRAAEPQSRPSTSSENNKEAKARKAKESAESFVQEPDAHAPTSPPATLDEAEPLLLPRARALQEAQREKERLSRDDVSNEKSQEPNMPVVRADGANGRADADPLDKTAKAAQVLPSPTSSMHSTSTFSVVNGNGNGNGNSNGNGDGNGSSGRVTSIVPPSNYSDRWKAVSSRGSLGSNQEAEAATRPKIYSASPRPRLSFPGVRSPALRPQDDSFFDVAAYSGICGEWKADAESLLRLELDNANGVAKTDGHPIMIKVDLKLVVGISFELNQDESNSEVTFYGSNGPMHKFTLVASQDSQGRLQRPRILSRKMLKWARSLNPDIPTPEGPAKK